MAMAFIPAKGTSQRVPEKNLRKLGSRNLVQRSLDFANAINEITTIVLSTDSLNIVEACEPFRSMARDFQNLEAGGFLSSGKWILHKRRNKDASPTARTIDAVLDFFDSYIGSETDFVLLQPTSPFRLITEWEEMHKIFLEGPTSLFSVHSLDSTHPKKSFQLLSSKSPDLNSEVISYLSSPAQILGQYFAPDGAFYFNRISQLLNAKSFIDLNSRIVVRNGVVTVNIDTEDDFLFAEYAAHRFNL